MRALGRRLAVLALSLAVVAAAAVLVAGPGYRFGGWGLGGAFLLLRWGAMLGLAAAALGALATVVALAQRARRGGRDRHHRAGRRPGRVRGSVANAAAGASRAADYFVY